MCHEIIYDSNRRMYRKHTARIIEVEKWICNKKEFYLDNLELCIFQFTGTEGFYFRPKDGLGPRLDISFELEDKTILPRYSFFEVNIYNEAMSLLKYKRMSPKLVRSIERNINKSIDIYIADENHIYFDIKQLMSLNYGYLY